MTSPFLPHHALPKLLLVLSSFALCCSFEPKTNVLGTWKSEAITGEIVFYTFKPDSSIEITSEESGFKRVRTGRFSVNDSQLSIFLTVTETLEGGVRRRETIQESDNVSFLLPNDQHLILQKGQKVLKLEKTDSPQ